MPDARATPSRVAILLNPRSGHVQRRLPALRRIAASVPEAQLQEASSPQDIAQALRDWRAAGPLDLLVVMGGDGTLQAALTALLQEQAGDLPGLLVVPGGTTNMSAADFGARLKPEAALRALSAWLQGEGAPPKTVERAVLRVEGETSRGPQFGMFFGAGAILNGVRYFHQHIRPTGLRGALGPALAFGRLLLSLLRNQPHPLLPAMPAHLSAADGDWKSDWLLVLASTLDRLLVGCRPYWGTEQAPVHFTAIMHRPRRLLRVLPPLLCGRGAAVAHEQDGYISRNLNALSLSGTGDFMLDGELFQAQEPIRLSATSPLRFLTF
ncbi:diacylglycerol/lipid kinase family protein [Azotobacter beijerinckii]|uniref:diacylglycerol/lipid kinase family protein n=1 Tax=Azotobacter beijerinckii TaxID=170623 RepID=UPI002954095B|nr:acylglycerol kinase family protein [Azotobacter beijerinckii]MDV7211650.1 acylglycerol kinase family protein [Azotobacter beijerinckii]